MSKAHQCSGLVAAAGSLVSAVAASACCWLPLLLIAFGASAGGVSAWFERYRSIFLTVAIALLALGFYFVYRPVPACVSGSACETPRPKLRRLNQSVIWIAAALVMAFALFPSYAAQIITASDDPAAASHNEADAHDRTLTLAIEGMTCEVCAVGLQDQLRKASGVETASVSYTDTTATVTLAAEGPATMESLTNTVKKAGYRVVDSP